MFHIHMDHKKIHAVSGYSGASGATATDTPEEIVPPLEYFITITIVLK